MMLSCKRELLLPCPCVGNAPNANKMKQSGPRFYGPSSVNMSLVTVTTPRQENGGSLVNFKDDSADEGHIKPRKLHVSSPIQSRHTIMHTTLHTIFGQMNGHNQINMSTALDYLMVAAAHYPPHDVMATRSDLVSI